ncbi:serine/threonine-protein kinase pim-2-like [Symphorus nematophorus]
MDEKFTQKMETQRSARDHAATNETQAHSSAGFSMDGGTASRKRKATPDLAPPRRKRRRVAEDLRIKVLRKTVRETGEGLPHRKETEKRKRNQTEGESASSSSSEDSATDGSSSRTGKRKAADDAGEGPSKKRTRIADRTDDKERTEDQDEQVDLRAEFEAKYEEQNQLGAGGCGSVFAGYRRSDGLPVAIKHILKDKVYCTHVDDEGRQLSVEVAIMLKIADGTTGSVGTSAPVSLLDWYDLDQELILVLERPVPCKDLWDYVNDRGGFLPEEEAKIIMKQLVHAAKDLQDNKIFHRDIKPANILIETGSDVPRVRIIDFGMGCFFKKRSTFRVFFGTSAHVPPEWVTRSTYRAGPTTVWQLGVVLFDSLHRGQSFDTTKFIKRQLKMKKRLSQDCLDFLQLCLTKVPERRPTLEDLQHHPWLR